jgi:hypothetical protein
MFFQLIFWYHCQKATHYVAYFFHNTVVTPSTMFIVFTSKCHCKPVCHTPDAYGFEIIADVLCFTVRMLI